MWTAAGALLGATAFAYMHSSLAPLTNAMPIRRNPTLPEVVGLPLGVLGPAVGVVLCGWALSASGALDGGAGAAAVTFGDMLALRYGGPAAPALGGLLVGCIQPPLMLALHKNAGASSTFVTLLANALPALGVRSAANNAYFLKKKEGLGNAWQVVFCVAIAAAASFLAGGSRAGVDPLREPLPPSGPLLSFVGGALVLFGSRLGSGCTSGHCMSGAGHLAIRSLAAVRGEAPPSVPSPLPGPPRPSRAPTRSCSACSSAFASEGCCSRERGGKSFDPLPRRVGR